ncbi:MAG: putative O-glycosylation ligase, exosortase A system-associated [Sphingomonas sp.]
MRDLAFVGFLATLFALGLKRPFLLVLAYVYIDIVSPQRLTYLLLNAVPISLIAVLLAVGGWALFDDKRDTRVAPRQILMLVLLVYCGITTHFADFPINAADKWDWVWKALAFAIFLPLTLRTRLRIEALLLFMILSAASIIIVGGIKTLVTGGGYGELNLMVTNNSGLYEGSTISAVAVAIIPIILWFTRFGTVFRPDWRVKTFCYALAVACLLIPIGTAARTGLLCIGLVFVLMLRDAKRRFTYLAIAAAVGLLGVPLLPQAFIDRMQTIQEYKGDSSASTRLAVWRWTIGYAQTHPFGGGFDAYRQNRISFETVKVAGSGGNQRVDATPEFDQARAYHSAYFEMLGEQGYPGLLLWLAINLGGVVRMEVLRQRYRNAAPDQAWAAPLASALQSAHLVYLLGAAFVGIAFQPFVYMLIGAQIGLDTYLGRRRRETNWRPIHRRPKAPAHPAISVAHSAMPVVRSAMPVARSAMPVARSAMPTAR